MALPVRRETIPAVQASLIVSTVYRLTLARDVAARLRHDERLHRAAMTGVFALEDLLFEMHRVPAESPVDRRRRRPSPGAA